MGNIIIDKCKNRTINGECSKCGGCCGNILPLTTKEIKTMKRLAKKYKIEGNKDKYSCPFLSADNKCLIYKDRPYICRTFKCDYSMNWKEDIKHLKNAKVTIVSDVIEFDYSGVQMYE